MRQAPRVLGALGLLIGCTQGAPSRPVNADDPAAGQTQADGDPPAPGGGDTPTAAEDGSSVLPPAVVTPSALSPFDPSPFTQFSPVLRAEGALPPLSGGTLAVAPDGSAVLSDPDRDQLYIVDPKMKSSLTIPLTAGDEPGRVTVHDKRAYVALRAGGALVTIDLATQKVSARTAICPAPRGVFFDALEARVLVACANGDLVSVSADGANVLATAQVASDLRDVGRDGQGIWVTQFRAAALLRLDASLKISARVEAAKTARIIPGGSGSLAFAPTLASRTVAGDSGEPWMLHQRAQTSPVNLSVGGYGSAEDGFCESGIVHTTITRFDSATPAVQAALPQAAVPLDLGLSPDGRFVAVIAPGNFVRQDIVPFESLERGGRVLGVPGPAQQLFFTRVEALKRATPEALLGDDAQDCVRSAGRWEHRFPGEATAIQFLDARSFLVQVRNPAELHVFSVDEADNPRLSAVIPLSPVALRDTGHEIFHQNTGAGLACASCHGEATDDAHVWSFTGIGERRTQNLRGGILAAAPFHWSGDLADMNALIDDVYQQRMGGTMLPADARAALASWLDRVPLVPSAARDPSAAGRGRALFQSAEVGCATCHAGDSLRSAGRHNVGTGESFEVPSLRGVSLRLPLMHNGCADTLEKRFEPSCGGGDKHGTTSHLNAEELADLVAYLESL